MPRPALEKPYESITQYAEFQARIFAPAMKEGADPRMIKFMLGNGAVHHEAAHTFRNQLSELFRRQAIVNHSIDAAQLLFDDEDPEPETFNVALSSLPRSGEEMFDISSISYKNRMRDVETAVHGDTLLDRVDPANFPVPGMAYAEALRRKFEEDPHLVPNALKIGYGLFFGTIFRSNSNGKLHVPAISALGGNRISQHLFPLNRAFDSQFLAAEFV